MILQIIVIIVKSGSVPLTVTGKLIMRNGVFLFITTLCPIKKTMIMTADNYTVLMTPWKLWCSLLKSSCQIYPRRKHSRCCKMQDPSNNSVYLYVRQCHEWNVPCRPFCFQGLCDLSVFMSFAAADGWAESWWSGAWTVSQGDLSDLTAFSSAKAHFHRKDPSKKPSGT